MRYRFVHAHQAEHRLTRLCQTLGVSRSGYYAWRRRPASVRTRANAQVLEHLQRLHRQTKARYGAVKMWHALLASGIVCGRHRVARLRRLHGLEAHRTRRFRMVGEQHQFAPPAPNRLHQVFVAPAMNRIWVGDITAIATRSGWLYLAVLLDLYSRRVIGWAMSAKPDQHLAIEALQMALVSRRPHQGLMHHTDQGATYTSVAYQHRLAEYGIAASMSRKGNCYDNAVAESFFSTLKNDLLSMSGTTRLARRRGLRSLSSLKCSIIGNGYTKRSAMSVPSSLKPKALSPFGGVYGIGGSSGYFSGDLRGRPRGRRVEARPSREAIRACQSAVPKGCWRFTQVRSVVSPCSRGRETGTFYILDRPEVVRVR